MRDGDWPWCGLHFIGIVPADVAVACGSSVSHDKHHCVTTAAAPLPLPLPLESTAGVITLAGWLFDKITRLSHVAVLAALWRACSIARLA